MIGYAGVLFTCNSKPIGSQYPVIPNSTVEGQWNTEMCGVLHFVGIQRLACRTISASVEFLVSYRQAYVVISSKFLIRLNAR